MLNCYILFIVKERKNDMHIILNHSSMVPIYEQLMEQIKSDIINSSLKEGEALPSVRSLAGELRISALTVKKAYDKLEGEGFVTTIHGKGTYVTASDKQLALEARQKDCLLYTSHGIMAAISTSPEKKRERHGFRRRKTRAAAAIEYVTEVRSAARTPFLIRGISPFPKFCPL